HCRKPPHFQVLLQRLSSHIQPPRPLLKLHRRPQPLGRTSLRLARALLQPQRLLRCVRYPSRPPPLLSAGFHTSLPTTPHPSSRSFCYLPAASPPPLFRQSGDQTSLRRVPPGVGAPL